MRIILDAVHEASFSGVDFEDATTFIAGEKCFDGESLASTNPFSLCNGNLLDNVAAFETITVHVMCIAPSLCFSNTLDIFWDVDVQVRHIQIVQMQHARIKIRRLHAISEERRASARQSNQDLVRHRRNNMLLLRQQRDVSEANLHRSGEEVPGFGHLAARTAVRTSARVCWSSEGAVHDSPLSVYNDCIPPVIRASQSFHIEDFAGHFQVATDDLGMQTDGIAHIADQHRDFLAAPAFRLHNSPSIDFSLEVILPGNSFSDPRKDGAGTLDVAAMWSTDVALGKCRSIDHRRNALEESCALIHKRQIGLVEVRWLGHRKPVQALVSFGKVMQLVDRVEDWNIEHIAPFRTIVALSSAERV